MTQLELATLAANLPTGTAPERVKLAFEIWMEADPVKAQHSFFTAKLDAIEAKAKQSSKMLIPFKQALKVILPDELPTDRPGKFKAFRAWQIKQGSDGPTLEWEKKNGVFFSVSIFDEIEKWRAAEKKSTARDKASNAAKARWNKEPETRQPQSKARGKTHQVKKRAKS